MTFTVTTNASSSVALASGLYRDDGEDISTGDGNEDSVKFDAGSTTRTQAVTLPDASPAYEAGEYEVNIEVWTRNKISEGESLADARCGKVTIRR